MKSAFMWLAALIVLFSTGILNAQNVYEWTDENGVRHFSNTGAPPDAEAVGTTAEKITPPAVEEQEAQEAAGEENEVLSNAPPSESSSQTIRERAEEARREQVSRRADDERQRLQNEISQIEQRGLSRTFTEGMRANQLQPLKEQLALLDADPVQYFRMKQSGAFNQAGRTSGNRDRRGGRTGAMRDGMRDTP
ncbi:MAG: DUF4124 domain-containing protein [Desulfobacterales bacterium]|nr:DUF4124 domain-containing protein [Desulfobacterales bacterium]